ncbi:MAG: thioredoxin [Clostridiales bacterium]|nr:thioredoxin [Clostridiales bacterium]
MKRAWRTVAAIALLVLAALFITLGMARGEDAGVYRKASIICLECIGIG